MKLWPCIARTVALTALASLFACGDDDITTLDAAADAAVDASADAGPSAPVRSIYALAPDPMPFGVMPFPDDLYLDESGHIALSEYPEENSGDEPSVFMASLRDGLATLDGFGVVSPIYLPFDGDLDPASLPSSPSDAASESASVFLLDADPDSPNAYERLEAEVFWLPTERMIAVRPLLPLRSGHRYAAGVTSAVTDLSGRAVQAAASFAEIRDAVQENEPPDDVLVAEAYERYAPVLRAIGTVAPTVVTMSVFRVQTAPDDLVQAREQLRAGAADVAFDGVFSGEALDALLGMPESNLPGRDVEGGVAHDAIGWMVQGNIAVPNYMSELENVHGRFERGESGDVLVKRVDRAPFTLTIPATFGDSLPVVIFQHGVSDNRGGVLSIANSLAAVGYATIAIDAPFHGLRSVADEPDTRNVWTGEDTPDGFGDIGGIRTVLSFVGASETQGEYPTFHPFYFRDALRQSAADLHALVHAIQAGDWSELSEADPALAELSLADSELAFVGHSLGGIIGTLFTATEPEVGAALLSVTGGHIGRLVERSFFFSLQLAVILPQLNLTGRQMEDMLAESILSPGMGLYQMMLAAGDSASYAALLQQSETHVLMHMVRHDETVPNSATEELALALDIPIVGDAQFRALRQGTLPLQGNVSTPGGSATRGLYLFDLGSHGSLVNRRGQQTLVQPPIPPFEALEEPISFDTPIDAMLSQTIAFFDSWQAGTAEISEP